MRFSLWIKLLTLVAISVATFFVTSSVLARGKHRRASGAIAATAADGPAGLAGMISKNPAPARGINTSYASGAMHWIKIETVGNSVHIMASASIRDIRPGVTYVWFVRVLHPNTGKVVFEKRYDDQIFGMPPEMEMKPTFEDRIDLPLEPGSYKVELVAFHVMPGEGLAVLNDAKIARFRRGPAGSAMAAIGVPD